eukprot:1139815-Pelagomonas_calceolata.AAC.1
MSSESLELSSEVTTKRRKFENSITLENANKAYVCTYPKLPRKRKDGTAVRAYEGRKLKNDKNRTGLHS